MALTGEEWLARVFRPLVQNLTEVFDARGAPVVYLEQVRAQLWAQIEALGDTGVLDDVQERGARAYLNSALGEPASSAVTAVSETIGAITESVTAIPSVVAAGTEIPPYTPPPTPRIVAVLAGPLEMAKFEPTRPLTLLHIERWTTHLRSTLFAPTSVDYRPRQIDPEYALEIEEWQRQFRRGEAGPKPPGARTIPATGTALHSLRWHLDDERGTPYSGGSVGGLTTTYYDHVVVNWQPAPPRGIERVTLTVKDRDTVLLTAELPVPDDPVSVGGPASDG